MEAGAMTHTMRCIDGGCLAVSDSQNILLRAGRNTRPGLNAIIYVYHRMQRNRLKQTVLLGQFDFGLCFFGISDLLSQINPHHHNAKQRNCAINQNIFDKYFHR